MANSLSVKLVLAGAGTLLALSIPWHTQSNPAHAQIRARPNPPTTNGPSVPTIFGTPTNSIPILNCVAVDDSSTSPRSEQNLREAFDYYELNTDPSDVVESLAIARSCADLELNVPLRDQVNTFLLAFNEDASTAWPNTLYPRSLTDNSAASESDTADNSAIDESDIDIEPAEGENFEDTFLGALLGELFNPSGGDAQNASSSQEDDEEAIAEEPTVSETSVDQLLAQWGWTPVDCWSGKVFISGLGEGTVCIEPTETIPAGEYTYDSATNRLLPVAERPSVSSDVDTSEE